MGSLLHHPSAAPPQARPSGPLRLQDLAQNRTQVLEAIQASCLSAGRALDEVCLIAVTKTVSCELAAELFALGCRDLGENRLPEFERKQAWFAERGFEPRWHFIGHIQRNKARRVASLAHEIHSVDSLRLLESLNQVTSDGPNRPGLYLQLKLNDEPEKGGLTPDELPAALELASAPGALPLLGLMTMAPLVQPDLAQAAAQRTFEQLAAIAAQLQASSFQSNIIKLSMGMSGDFDQAIQAGAHAIRIGSAFFQDAATAVKESKN
jgi:pyridoxal phosphate enzyme (YggS family)